MTLKPFRPFHLLRTLARLVATLALCQSATAQGPAPPSSAPAPPLRLRVVGGLAGLHQFTRHEEPFWTSELPRLSAGRYSAEVVPFDRAGMRGGEMLQLLQLGTVPFGTLLLGLAAPPDQDLSAPDLAGLNPDMASLRRSVTAFRSYLQRELRARYGLELLAVYTYPAQVLFCNRPFGRLRDLQGLRIRSSTASQADWVEALGAQAVTTPFAQLLANVKAGHIDCAITGTMSGNTIGLHAVTTHLHALPVSWGVSVFAANGAAWQALPAELRTLLRRELPRLEHAVWESAQRETDEGTACNLGAPGCNDGQRGRMAAVPTAADDEPRRRELFAATVLPRWLARCGARCAQAWNQTLAGVTGVTGPAGNTAPAAQPR